MVIELTYLLDTNICIYIAKQKPVSVLDRFSRLRPGQVGMSVITSGELAFGAAKSNFPEAARNNLAKLHEFIPALPMDAAVAETYGEIRAALQAAGKPIGNNDLWIAAHALQLGVILVSNNTREFSRIPQLKLEDWV